MMASVQKITLPWGSASLTVALPESWRVLGELLPRSLPAAKDVVEVCSEAIRKPIDAIPLRDRDLSHQRIVVVTEDHTRPTPVASFLRVVLKELQVAGVKDAQVDFLIATGVHRSSRPEEVACKLGQEALSRFRWCCHDAYNQHRLVNLGTTIRGTPVWINQLLVQADLIICIGTIEPHLLMGFGGGLKMIVPGCAGNETIGKNHLQGVDAQRFDLVGVAADESPMRLDLEEAAELLGEKIFIVNAVMNEAGQPAKFFCGDPVAAHRAGENFIRMIVGLNVPELADVVLTNSYPMDSDLRQSIKCVGNALFASKPGGVMMGCVRCQDGLGEIPLPARTLPYAMLRTLVRVIGKHRILALVKRLKKAEPVEEVFISHFGLQMLRRNHLALFSDGLPADTGRKLGLVRTFSDSSEMVHWSAKKVPRRATVWIFPYGGATYACRG
ncbi:MAG: nickel-dependent lactate racemase [bacterium]